MKGFGFIVSGTDLSLLFTLAHKLGENVFIRFWQILGIKYLTKSLKLNSFVKLVLMISADQIKIFSQHFQVFHFYNNKIIHIIIIYRNFLKNFKTRLLTLEIQCCRIILRFTCCLTYFTTFSPRFSKKFNPGKRNICLSKVIVK